MNLKNKSDQELLYLYQETRSERRHLQKLEVELRKEINTRHGVIAPGSYPNRIKQLNIQQLRDLAKTLEPNKIDQVLRIIENG